MSSSEVQLKRGMPILEKPEGSRHNWSFSVAIPNGLPQKARQGSVLESLNGDGVGLRAFSNFQHHN